MKVSFVIPAHNEERLLGRTLEAMHRAASEVIGPGAYEVIVVDDSSTDRTAEIAGTFAAAGTRVVRVEKRQISATRAARARAALADRLIFVDADTSINTPVLRGAVGAFDSGAVGGGAGVSFDDGVPLWAKVLAEVVVYGFRLARVTGGCFLFCTRAAYEKAGGWDETFFAGEEIEMCRALRRLGRFVILRQRVTTSARKLRTHSVWEMLGLFVKAAFKGKKMLKTREGLGLWYDERRAEG